MLKIKPYFLCIVICMLIFSGCSTGASDNIKDNMQQIESSVNVIEYTPQTESASEQESGNDTLDTSRKNINIDEIVSGVNKVELAYGDKSLFITADEKIISTIISYLKQCNQPFNGTGVEKLPMWEDNKIILYKNDGTKVEIKYLAGNIGEIAWIEIDSQRLSMDYDFYRYIQSLYAYSNHFTDVAADVAGLFTKYNWTIGYRINSFVKTLPENLKHSTGEFPFKLYWANCSELSKSIGLDFENYLGKQVDVELYCLKEKLPESLHYSDARGIILRYEGKIIGAYLDGGRSGRTCSLEGKTLENAVHKDWDTWVKDYINYDDEFENYLARLGPEDIVREYFKAVNSHDIRKARGCMTRTAQYDAIYMNMDTNQLFNEGFEEDITVKAILQDIKKWEMQPDDKNQIKYFITAEYEFTKYFAPNEGPHFVTVVHEDTLGWRIVGLGTGP